MSSTTIANAIKERGKINVREKVIHLSPLYIPPARKEDVEGPVLKVIQYKYEFNLDWYLLTFKDQLNRPQWQQYRNLVGCDKLITDFWGREEAGASPMDGPFGSSKFLRLMPNNDRNNDNVYLKDLKMSEERNDAITQIQ
ncbi:6048_t:CDS:2, partial [Scutellospora calospora]